MLSVGDQVEVKPPFNHTFPEVYEVEAIVDGQFKLAGIEGLFDERYLEKV